MTRTSQTRCMGVYAVDLASVTESDVRSRLSANGRLNTDIHLAFDISLDISCWTYPTASSAILLVHRRASGNVRLGGLQDPCRLTDCGPRAPVCGTYASVSASPVVLVPNDCPGVQALSASRQGTLDASSGGLGQTSVSTSKDPLAVGSSTSIPWTIVNKYYTADVHFETHEFEQFRVHHAVGVPAIIYVWGPGEVRPFQASFLPCVHEGLLSARVAVQGTHPGDRAEVAALRS